MCRKTNRQTAIYVTQNFILPFLFVTLITFNTFTNHTISKLFIFLKSPNDTFWKRKVTYFVIPVFYYKPDILTVGIFLIINQPFFSKAIYERLLSDIIFFNIRKIVKKKFIFYIFPRLYPKLTF